MGHRNYWQGDIKTSSKENPKTRAKDKRQHCTMESVPIATFSLVVSMTRICLSYIGLVINQQNVEAPTKSLLKPSHKNMLTMLK